MGTETVTLPAHYESLSKIRERVFKFIDKTSLASSQKNLIVLAVDEVVSSIIDYVDAKNAKADITLTLQITDKSIKIVIEDNYDVYNLWFEKDVQVLNKKIELERKHQLGLQIVKIVMEQIRYTYRKGQVNKLELTKFL
jgi:anti-sigma regulatory factor (Ser/Thr protein kinase)